MTRISSLLKLFQWPNQQSRVRVHRNILNSPRIYMYILQLYFMFKSTQKGISLRFALNKYGKNDSFTQISFSSVIILFMYYQWINRIDPLLFQYSSRGHRLWSYFTKNVKFCFRTDLNRSCISFFGQFIIFITLSIGW